MGRVLKQKKSMEGWGQPTPQQGRGVMSHEAIGPLVPGAQDSAGRPVGGPSTVHRLHGLARPAAGNVHLARGHTGPLSLAWLAGWLAAWLLPGWLPGWLPGCLAAWLPGCLANYSALAGLPAGWLLLAGWQGWAGRSRRPGNRAGRASRPDGSRAARCPTGYM